MKLLSSFLLILSVSFARAQETNTINVDSVSQQIDSIAKARDSVKAIPKSKLPRVSVGVAGFEFADTSIATLLQNVELLTYKLNAINATLKRGYDTTYISEGLPEVEDNINIAKEHLSSYSGSMNLRNMKVTRSILSEMQKKLDIWQKDLLKYTSRLSEMNREVIELVKDSSMRYLPRDTALRRVYMEQIKSLSKKWVSADSANRKNIVALGLIQSRIAYHYLTVEDMQEELDYRITTFNNRLWKSEFRPLWRAPISARYENNIKDVIRNSYQSNSKVLKYYIENSWSSRLLSLLIGIGFYVWTLITIRQIKKNHPEADRVLANASLLSRKPFWSALVVLFILAPFFYMNPPSVYLELLQFFLFLASSILLWRYVPRTLFDEWLVAVALYLIYAILNLFIQTAYSERWLLLVLGLISTGFGIYILKSLKGMVIEHKNTITWLVYLYIGMHVASVILNIFGRFTLAKVFGSTATFSLMLAIYLGIFIELLNQFLYLLLESSKHSKSLFSTFNLKNFYQKMQGWLFYVAVAFWGISFLQYMNVYDGIYKGLIAFLKQERHLGNVDFTFGSIMLFIFIIWVSSILVKFITLIFDGEEGGPGVIVKKSKLGSALLLVRLGVITLGVLIAFAASGIPMDKLAIVIGALGVGIGFGMQNIVNNLVSGIIVAFEKPIEVGDVIEVGTKNGVVKNIGFRSSTITTYDGASVIIPNGDLISQQLINWTHSDRSRRIEIIIGVAYGTDVEKAIASANRALQGHEHILRNPEPSILVHQFAESSVDLRILFWTHDFDSWVQLKSEVMTSVYKNFAEDGMQIPFPQRDLHVKSMDPEVIRNLGGHQAK